MTKLFNSFLFLTLLVFNIIWIAPLSALEKTQTTLLLHFDINKTLIAVDPASNQTLDQILNALLAEKYTYKWSSEIEKPISYQDYVENHLFPGPSYDQDLKKKRRALIGNFIHFMRETHHPLESQVVEAYHNLDTKLREKYLFSSFLNLIDKLKTQEIKFHIILRTFGNDLDTVIAAVAQAFPDQQFLAKGNFFEGKLHLASDTSNFILEDLSEAYIFFKTHGHIAIQDNWEEWNNQHENKEYAKRFPIDLEDRETLSLFFDDNIKEKKDSVENIVTPVNIKTGELLDISQLIEQKHIFRVNTFQAILDDNYFIDLINQSLEASGRSFRILTSSKNNITAEPAEIAERL